MKVHKMAKQKYYDPIEIYRPFFSFSSHDTSNNLQKKY